MDVFSLIHTARSMAASDLHLIASSPPLVRVNGRLETVNGTVPLTSDETSQAFSR